MRQTLTETQQLFLEYSKKNSFINEEIYNDFKIRLVEENNLKTISVVLENFAEADCPKCGAYGFFKAKTFGKLNHDECAHTWYLSSGKYIMHQIKWLVNSGNSLNKQNDDVFAKIFGFLIPFSFRFPFAVLSIPIQMVISIINNKSSNTK